MHKHSHTHTHAHTHAHTFTHTHTQTRTHTHTHTRTHTHTHIHTHTQVATRTPPARQRATRTSKAQLHGSDSEDGENVCDCVGGEGRSGGGKKGEKGREGVPMNYYCVSWRSVFRVMQTCCLRHTSSTRRCCSVLQRVAACCSVLQRVADLCAYAVHHAHCSGAVSCSLLQNWLDLKCLLDALLCALIHTISPLFFSLCDTHVCCSVLQRVAACCSAL